MSAAEVSREEDEVAVVSIKTLPLGSRLDPRAENTLKEAGGVIVLGWRRERCVEHPGTPVLFRKEEALREIMAPGDALLRRRRRRRETERVFFFSVTVIVSLSLSYKLELER